MRQELNFYISAVDSSENKKMKITVIKGNNEGLLD